MRQDLLAAAPCAELRDTLLAALQQTVMV